MHDGRTESSTFGGATSLLQWTDGARTGSNGCSDCVPSSAWCCWSPGSVVAAQQWKGAEARVWQQKLKIDGRGSTIYRYCGSISCATRIRTQLYLEFDSNAGFVEI
jgi:hypothetical protein